MEHCVHLWPMFIISQWARDAIYCELKKIVSELKRAVQSLKEAVNEFRITLPETAALLSSFDA